MNRPRRIALICGLLAALTLVTYWPVLHHEFIGFDDQDYVTENDHVQRGLNRENVVWAFRSTEAANWHPLTWLAHMLDVQLFGLKPGLHHLTSLALHIANCLLLFLLLQRITGAPWRSAFVAALFALHPLHVESVAWVAERKDVLSTMFFMLTLLAYARYVEASQGLSILSPEFGNQRAETRKQKAGSPQSGPRATHLAWFFYLLALLCFALGLMSKPMLVTLPFVLLLIDHWPFCRFRASSFLRQSQRPETFGPSSGVQRFGFVGLLMEKIPFFALSAASAILTLVVQRGAIARTDEFPMTGRVINAVASYLRYLGKTVWPADLAVFYPHPANPRSGLLQWSLWQAAGAGLILAGISVFALLRRKRQPWLSTGWFWYLLTMAPVIGLIQAGSQAMADRYTYIPLIGIFLCVSWGLPEFLLAWRRHREGAQASLETATRSGWGATTVAVAALAVFACAVLTRKQLAYWQNDFTLFSRALVVNERNAPAHAILGAFYGRQGKYGFALAHCKAAIEADPSYAGAWHTMGDTYDALGRTEEAVPCYVEALRWSPRLKYSWFRLGCVYSTLGKAAEAESSYRKALELAPDFVPAHNNLGTLLWGAGRRDEALKEFAEAVRFNPRAPDKHYNLGVALERGGNLVEAAAQYREATRLKPDYAEAWAALGLVLARQGKAIDALGPFEQIVGLRPADPEVRVRFGGALLMAGRTNEAAASFAEALRLEPDLARKAMETGADSLRKGNLDDALRSFTTVTWLEPGNVGAHERLGLLLANRGQLDGAASHLQEALRLAPNADSFYNLGRVLAQTGKLREAAFDYQQALMRAPDLPAALNDLAWIFATAPQPELRNAAEALRLAQRACELTGRNNPTFLATLAAAHAEAGRFPEAVAITEKARDLAVAAADKNLVQSLEKQLALYREGKPFRQ